MAERATCLLTGASGFVGGHLAEHLLRSGHAVRCLVRASSDTRLLDDLGVEIVRGELGELDCLRAAVAGCTHVVHCAALVSDWATVAEIERANVAGTRNLAHAAVESSVERFVQISSTDVYGHPGRPQLCETYVAPRFANWYAETKLLAERELWRVADRSSLAVVVIRPASVYGPRSVSVVGEIAQALRAGNMLLVDGGRHDAGLLYVGNLAELVELALEHPAAAHETFNATDALGVTWRRFTDDLARGLGARPARLTLPYPVAHALGSAMERGYRAARRVSGLGTRPLLSRQAVQVIGRDQSFSNAKARELLGWSPRVGYEEGLSATLAWLRETAEASC
ncbi:MAG: NAD-dependent epimerase/dehydratase family protein [Solirubrobacteraceae bacterium]